MQDSPTSAPNQAAMNETPPPSDDGATAEATPDTVTLPLPSEAAEPMESSQDGPNWDAYPLLMSPQQIAEACSITDAQARMNGKRGYYRKKHTHMRGRKELTFYERANVQAYYVSQTEPQTFTEESPEASVPMATGAASLLKSLDTLAKKTETEASHAATIETSANTIADLVRQNQKLVDRVGELERRLREQSEQWIPVAFGLFRRKS